MSAIGDRIVTGRKPHRCDYCGETIPVGTRHRRWAWVDDTCITMRAHIECERFAHQHGIFEPTDDIDSEWFRQWVTEHPDIAAKGDMTWLSDLFGGAA